MPTSTVPIRNLRLLLAILIAAVTTAQPRGAASDVLPFKAAELAGVLEDVINQ